MRSKKAIYNTISSVFLQIITCICGLIIPRLILNRFGSEVNGSIQSITQFLNYIVLLEAGVGGVVRAALYKPLATNDSATLSGIINATERFFRKIAYIFIIYLFIVAFLYPYIIIEEFDFFYTFSLVIIIGIGTIAQYYFGITYQIMLTADQNGYIWNTLQVVTVIINSLLTFILIKLGAGIHIVKLFSALIFVIRPLILNWYVRKKYKELNKKAAPNNELIKQRWDGLGQHIAFFVHNNTDIVILTLFDGLKSVSVYSVYYMVVSGLEKIVSSIAAGFTPIIGNMYALEDKKRLLSTVSLYEFLAFTVNNIIFTVCAFLIVPFVKIYTSGITDVNYVNYVFGYLAALSSALLIIRNIYQNIVLSAGHYKQATASAWIETLINIVLSLLLVVKLGLCGVMIGTVISLIYRTLYYIVYLNKNILNRKIIVFFKRVLINIFGIIICIMIYNFFKGYIMCSNYLELIIEAIFYTVVVSVIIGGINILLYRNEFLALFHKFKNIIFKQS